MRRALSAIFFSLSMVNTCFAVPFVRPQPVPDTTTTEAKTPDVSDVLKAKKFDEAAATVTALKHCLAMDGSLNQQYRLVDAFNYQPDLDHLPQKLSDAEREKIELYIQGRPDISDFGFLIPDIWRITNRNARIKFDAIMSLKLAQALGFEYGALAFAGNCKPVMDGDITAAKNYEYVNIAMPLAFNDKQVRLVYMLSKQDGYNWQIDDLLIDNVGVTNYVKKDLTSAVATKGVADVAKEICRSVKQKNLKCDN